VSVDNQGVERVGLSDETLIEVRDISVTFDMDRGVSRVLNNVSLDIQREEILGVVGESGSGKSMLASALLDAVVNPGQLDGEITYYPSDSEPIDILNLEPAELKQFRWERISMVFQGALDSFNPTMRIKGHFKETLDAHGHNKEEGLERAHELLEDLYLDPERVLGSYPHELSGGMKQRALIALSLVLEPEVLVMDEPTAALDLLMQRSIIQLIDEIQEKYDITVLFITHDIALVAELVDRLAVMYAFEFVEIGDVDDIMSRAAHPYTRALLKTIPNLGMELSQMQPIKGSSPDPVNAPEGCSYHPRCSLADETCRTKNPDYQRVSEDHESACFYWEEAEEAVPFE